MKKIDKKEELLDTQELETTEEIKDIEETQEIVIAKKEKKDNSAKSLKTKRNFSKIEILYIIVMLAIIMVAGIGVVAITTKNADIKHFKEQIDSYLGTAKNAYLSYSKQGNTTYIRNSTDGTTKGMCITLEGLKKNEFYINDLEDWNGYIVIEELADKSFKYSIWITDGKYVINGYDSERIADLNIKEGEIEAYNDNDFTKQVKTSFTGTTKDKGGTGSDSSTKKYEAVCINEKIE